MSNKKTEIFAGIVAGFVAIPQCVALGVSAFAPFHGEYSTLAQVTGFASAIIAGLFVALFGRGQISLTGPRIGATIVIAGTITSFLQPTAGVSLPHASVLGLILIVMMLAGAMQALMGHAQLASLHNYIARPVIVGLLSGVAAAMLVKQVSLMITAGLGFSVIALVTAGVAILIWRLGKNPSIKFWKKDWVVRLGIPIAAFSGIGLFYLLKPVVSNVGGTLNVINQFWMWPEVSFGLSAAVSTLSGRLDMLWNIISAAVMLAIVGSIDTTTAYINTKKKLQKPKLSQSESITIGSDNENNELKWHGVGNFFAAWFGGMTSAASDARATAAVGVGGRTWLAGLVYVLFLTALLVSSPLLPWTDYFPQAVVSGLMLQIALVLLDDQRVHLKRYFFAIRDAAISLIEAPDKNDSARIRPKFFETALNGVSVLAVAMSLTWFDPLKAVALGMLCSMSIFLFKISQSQRHRCYLATERGSLESRSPVARAAAENARKHCHIIKLHGDYFFLSRKKANDLYRKINQQKAMVADIDLCVDQYVIIDFDMAHEFDDSGISEIKVLIEKLQAAGFVVLLSYLKMKSDLLQLLIEDAVVARQGEQSCSGKVLINDGHIFESTERAINFVEDVFVQSTAAMASMTETEVPPQLHPILDQTSIPGNALGESDVPAKFWLVRTGKVTLCAKVRQSVADVIWSKVVAEVGPYGVISDRALRQPDLTIKSEHGTEVVPISEAFIIALKLDQPLAAADLLEYLLDHLADSNAMLQLEAMMLDH